MRGPGRMPPSIAFLSEKDGPPVAYGCESAHQGRSGLHACQQIRVSGIHGEQLCGPQRDESGVSVGVNEPRHERPSGAFYHASAVDRDPADGGNCVAPDQHVGWLQQARRFPVEHTDVSEQEFSVGHWLLRSQTNRGH